VNGTGHTVSHEEAELLLRWRHPFAPTSLMGRVALGVLEPSEAIALANESMRAKNQP